MEQINQRKVNAPQAKEERLKRQMDKERANLNPNSVVGDTMKQNLDFARNRSNSVAKLPTRLDGTRASGSFKAGNFKSPSPGKKGGKFAPNNLSTKVREMNQQNEFTPAPKVQAKKKGFFGF
jgi:hypothetical protein